MTFYEAAIEVLRRSGRPLHFKKITEVAIRDELLSHVGKAPEVTMGERLDQETKKAQDSWVIKTRPGVFTLRDDVIDRLNEEAAERGEAEEKEEKPPANERKSRGRRREEKPDEAEAESSEQEEDDDDGSRRRRRRRRSGRDSKDGDNKGGNKKDDSRGNKHAPTPESDRRKRNQKKGGSVPDVSGRYETVSEAAYAVLQAANRTPLDVDTIAETIFAKKLVKFHTHDRAATVQSAIVTDNQVQLRSGRRPLFAAYSPSLWGLTEWGLSDNGIEKEKELQQLSTELREDACGQLGELLVDLKPEALEMMVITLLERLDYRNLKVSKRTSEGDVFFTADWRRGFSDIRVCIQVVGEPDVEIDAEEVKELRDTLSHYSGNEGILIHLGDVSKAAVKESRDEEKDKVTVIDGAALVRLLVHEGIGVRTYRVPVTMVDTAFVKALKG